MPHGWYDAALFDLVTIKSGQVDPRVSPYRELPLIAPDHLASGTGRLIKKVSASAQGAISGKYLVRPGEVIYSKIRPYLQKAYRCDFEALCSADMYPLTPRRGVDSSFILHSLLGHDFTNFAVSVSARSGIPKINREELAEYRMSVPGWAEQRAIGQALDDADNLIAALERLIAKKQAIKQGMMQQLLTGETRLPSYTGMRVECTLGEVARIKTGSRNNQDKVASGRYPFFVRSATVERINSYSYDCEAVLVPGEGGIGSIFHYVDGKFEVHQRVYMISGFAPDVSGRYIYHFMRQYFGAHAMENSVKATVDSLRLPTFKNFLLQVPPVDEQRAIVDAMDDAEAELRLLRGRLEKARVIKQGMMQQLLTGRARLPVEALE
ncbi:restriction endonuclease subunit S [Agromyces aerolatus]|uniref:restriction endonuclease subunit S n=1 Tax=Agromyces sp. LY-1074 TaxID=3074080 RepID=UPI00285C78AB|nr:MULTISPECIES: restriction endonuclease subunit S [unclassified Agromyces]MDR5700718.1 restriction endonuclease subunit S [Agromyces sp. LY-1074]MDR5707239.1 restriction endonuclease subunit S [Agromyces sp. LY-1358]